MGRTLALCLALLAGVAQAAVGKVGRLDGAGTRTPKGGAAVALAAGADIELGDTLKVSSGHLTVVLTDESVIALSTGAVLEITQAEFEGQERSGFSGFLKAGSVWSKVKKALGGGGFEITTERAVAGVRGTIFRVDADTLVKGAKASLVRVVEGVVRVRPSTLVAQASKAQVPRSTPKGPRLQVPGPTEVSADEWERRFVELQKNQQVAVGVDLWEEATVAAAASRDAFSKYIEKL